MSNALNTCIAFVTGLRPGKKAAGSKGEKGFSLIELLIAMAITVIASAAVYSLYNNFFRQSNTQDMVVEAQQNARVAINSMERELMNAGYAAGTPDIITEAGSNALEFIYSDPSTDTSMSATAGKRLKVRYATQTTGGVTYLTRKADNLTDGTMGATEQIIPYAQNLAITYYDINGNTITDTSTQANRNSIKFLTVALTTQTKSNVQGTNSPKTFMVETHIRLRNIGVGQTSNDTTPPAAPTGVQVRDPGICGRLKVKWTANTEGDISGYKIYYGTATGNYTGVINVPLTVMSGSTYSCSNVSGSIQCTIFPTAPALAYTPSTAAPGTENVYYVAVKAYDNSLNHSPYSTEVSGNPGTSNPNFDSGSDDSTLNPVKPAPVTGLAGADAATENQVALSWTAYNRTANPDVVGFRLYRSTSPFSSYPIDPTMPNIDWIAGEPGSGKPELTALSTTYTDPGPGLVGCRTYYYAIAPVNCDSTLIPDNGGDPNAKKYLQTDYNATCGDGSSACTPGTGFAAATGSDTAPAKTTAPGAPTINARAAWKRVALSLTQPSDPDLSQTCVYSNEGVTYPALQTNTGLFPKTVGCYQVDTSATPSAIRIYENNGIFSVSTLPQSQSTSFWHNSMTSLTATPSLLETGTYSYRAVSFDLCGNGSAITGAQATTTLCGEDPVSGEKPPAVTNLNNSCCASPVTLTWTGVSSDLSMPSSINNPYDLAGYRIFRGTSSSDWTGSALLNPAAPFWGTSYNDATVSDGGTYYYRVATTDCPYEKNSPSSAQIISDMVGNTIHSTQIGPIYPGRIGRDEKTNATKDDHREVLTGVDIDNTSGNGTGASSPISTFTHNRVTLFFENTMAAAGSMTIQSASVNWVNSSAYLREIVIGGGNSGVGQTSTSITQGQTVAVAGNPPYTSGVSNIALTSAIIAGGKRHVPIMFKFKDASDNPIDMRDDQLLIMLTVRNDSTGTTNCVTYLTVSGDREGISIPFGPSITATQQNKPSSPTFSYAVPGSTGLNTVPSGSNGSIVVNSSNLVTVSASISGNTTDETTGSKIPVSSATLYYKDTDKTATTAPSSGFTAIAMTNSGGIWSATIPNKDGRRVWYYIVAYDNDGNWDRDPEIGDGDYVYDQKDFTICDVTPSAPTGLTATSTGTGPYNINLAWTAPTTYTTGANIVVGDTIKYRVYRSGVQIGGDQSGTTYTDLSLSAGVYAYTVKAINSCASPGPNVSTDSNTGATCAGNNGQANIVVSPTSIYRGQSYTVTIVDCLAVNGAYASTVETVNTTSGFTGFTNTSTAPLTGSINPYSPTVPETGPATATFTKTITTTGSVTDTNKLLTLTSDTITVTYPYASPSSRTVSVVVDPCTDTPKAPTGLTGTVSANKKNITLSWAAVTQNTDNSAITDLGGYKVYEKVCKNGFPDCTGSNIKKDWFVRTSVASGTVSTTVGADQTTDYTGGIYYFYVTAKDSCATPNESAASSTINENTN